MRHQVFLSCASQDMKWADQFARALDSYNVRVWYKIDDFSVGDRIADHIQEGLDRSDTLILLLSQDSMNSSWMFIEIGAAITTRKNIISVVIDESDLSDFPFGLVRNKALREKSPGKAAREISKRLEAMQDKAE